MTVVDTNILSTFFCVNAFSFLQQTINVEQFAIPEAVKAELEQGIEHGYLNSNLVQTAFTQNNLKPTQLTAEEETFSQTLPLSLGKGERECIAIAYFRAGALLTNDRRAANYCQSKHIPHLTLPAILRLAWLKKIATQSEIVDLMSKITQREGFIFKNVERIFE